MMEQWNNYSVPSASIVIIQPYGVFGESTVGLIRGYSCSLIDYYAMIGLYE
jgi:hypothetical protein